MIRPGSSISRAKVTNNLQSVMIARKKVRKPQRNFNKI